MKLECAALRETMIPAPLIIHFFHSAAGVKVRSTLQTNAPHVQILAAQKLQEAHDQQKAIQESWTEKVETHIHSSSSGHVTVNHY
eukprot:1020994-Amphidinium_carterae.1